MNSPNSTSDSSSWNQLGSLGVPATDVIAEGGVDPGSISPPETRLRGIDIQTPQITDNTLTRPVQIDPRYIAPTRRLLNDIDLAQALRLTKCLIY